MLPKHDLAGAEMSARIGIIIPTWNRVDLARECLQSLRAQTYRDFEAILVDDGSTDGTADRVGEEFPETRVMSLPSNQGFAAAVNAGIRAADHELIVLLNNDMTLDPLFLAELVGAADTSDAAFFAPLILWRDEADTIYSAGDRQRQDGRPEPIGFRAPLRDFPFNEALFGTSAGAALYRRSFFEAVGFLDERFVAYFEDCDLSFRARLLRLHPQLVREAVAYHRGSATIEGRTWWRARQCYRNHALLVLKNMPVGLVCGHAWAIVAERWNQTRMLVSSARCEFGLVRALAILARAQLSLLAAFPHALGERRRIRRNCQLTPEELDVLLAPCNRED